MKVRALPDHPCAGAPRRRDTFSHPILFYIGYFGSIAHFFFFFKHWKRGGSFVLSHGS